MSSKLLILKNWWTLSELFTEGKCYCPPLMSRPRLVVERPKVSGEKLLAWGLVAVTVVNLLMITVGLAMIAP
jgi:hypothetical protein